MAVEIRVPQLGESIAEATIARWLKKPGDSIKAEEIVVELETDKVNVEVPSASAGVLESITHQAGDTVSINELLGLVSDGGAGAAVPEAVPAPAANDSAVIAAPAPVTAAESDNGRSKAAVSPVAERVAEANNVDLAQIKGSGIGGKVTKEDVEAHLSSAAPSASPAALAAVAPVPAPSPAPIAAAAVTPAALRPASAVSAPNSDPRVERKPMTRRRQAIAANLKVAQNTAAMLTTFNEVDMSAVMDLRKRRNEAFEKRNGVKIGFMSFFTKAAIGALKAFPLLNAEIEGTDLLIKHYYDIGIAVGAAEGLVVPVVRNADQMTFAAIEKEIAALAGRARDNKLGIADMMGGSFTITNGGVFGSLMSTPILNYPQVGILGLHKIQERPIVVNGEIVIKPMMYLALSYDHRIVDGSEAVRFLVRVKELIEDPESLLLEG